MAMKIVAISGSSRDKKTNHMLRKVLEASGNKYEKELILLKDKEIKPCRNCKVCHKNPFRCAISDDMQEIHQKLKEADVILLGSPTYFDNVSGLMKNFMDRCLCFYFSEEMKGRRVALVSIGNFTEHLEFNDAGNCVWCQRGNRCTETVERCMKSLEYFCEILGMKIIGKVLAIHGDPKSKDRELEKLGQKICS